jgi:hypothetical protein
VVELPAKGVLRDIDPNSNPIEASILLNAAGMTIA